MGDLTLAENLSQLDRAKQCQSFYDRIVTGRYNGKYRGIREENRAYYLKAEYKGRDHSMITRFRCGNEERGSRAEEKMDEENNSKKEGDRPEIEDLKFTDDIVSS
ncbi:uncharacterized protein LOC114880277 [Osmia bicornis bicornis]|uniref:uncharacterized protein LOC114880277 n=1 Tax=Osmia bicornis bicornis TaxID=1437191 RepID=UPI001EAF6410|nr:uncharacterized protein LOC114880277 [Osmia bicornis bicornis]